MDSTTVIVSIGILALLRTTIVFRVQMRRIREVHDRNKRAIDRGFHDLTTLFLDYDSSFLQYIWLQLQLTKWFYTDFYPDPLVEYGLNKE